MRKGGEEREGERKIGEKERKGGGKEREGLIESSGSPAKAYS